MYADISDRLASRLWIVVVFVVVLSLLLLTMLFRAPVVALKAAMMNMLSVAAAYGAAWLAACLAATGRVISSAATIMVAVFIGPFVARP